MARVKAKAITGSPGGRSPLKSAAKAGKTRARQKIEATSEMAVSSGEAKLILPDVLNSASAADIKDQLVARRGAPLIVDAGQVRRVGVQALQVLIAAARTWRTEGQSYVVTDPSSALLETITLVGLSGDQFLLEGASA
jgi:anti-anti-sigma regulatory factor